VEEAVPAPEPKPREQRKKTLAFAAGGAAIVLMIAGVVLWHVFASPQARILRAVWRGELVAPEGTSAYDVYQRLKAKGLSSGTRDTLRSQVLWRLNVAGEQFLGRSQRTPSRYLPRTQ